MSKNKEFQRIIPEPVDPSSMEEPTTAEGCLKRGMAFYARKRHDAAEKDFLQAIALDPGSTQAVDAYYGLGMVYKAAKRDAEAVQSFEKVLELLRQGSVPNANKTEMLRRLALGHANEMKNGDWNLKGEIWHQVQ